MLRLGEGFIEYKQTEGSQNFDKENSTIEYYIGVIFN